MPLIRTNLQQHRRVLRTTNEALLPAVLVDDASMPYHTQMPEGFEVFGGRALFTEAAKQQLTLRQLQVLALIATGLTIDHCEKPLLLGRGKVKSHLADVYTAIPPVGHDLDRQRSQEDLLFSLFNHDEDADEPRSPFLTVEQEISPSVFERFTPKQLEVGQYVGQGDRNGEIADKLGVSITTVKTHVTAAGGHLGAGERTITAGAFILGGHVELNLGEPGPIVPVQEQTVIV